MKINFLTFSLILFIFSFINNSQCAPNMTPEEELPRGVASLAVGIALISAGILKACNIPITSMQEVSLCLQYRLSKENLKKLHLGRKIIAYSLISSGVLATIAGLGSIIKTARTR